MQNNKQRKKNLENLLNSKTDLYYKQAETEGTISKEKVEELDRLSRLVTIKKSLQVPAPVKWPIILLLATTLIIVSVLLFVHVSSTEIELDISVSKMNFRLPEEQVLTNDIIISSLGISGVNEVKIPRSENKDEYTIAATDDAGSSVRLSPVKNDSLKNSVTLETLILPGNAKVDIGYMENAGHYRLSFENAPAKIVAGVNGLVTIGQPAQPPEQLNFVSPQPVYFKTGNKYFDLDINVPATNKNIFSRQLVADSLYFFDVEKHEEDTQTIVRKVSTILSGTLYLEALDKEQILRAGQRIEFTYSKGEIRTIELKSDHIELTFHGIVKGMSTGSTINRTNLMPTYLEWLSARHGLSLLWGTTFYFFGLLFSVWRWWRTKP